MEISSNGSTVMIFIHLFNKKEERQIESKRNY